MNKANIRIDNTESVKRNQYYLLELYIEGTYYLLCKAKDNIKSLMVWESLQALEQSLINTGGVLLPFEPWPIRITEDIFPSIQDLDFNPILLELTNKECITDIPFLHIAGLTLIAIDEDKIIKHRMIGR